MAIFKQPVVMTDYEIQAKLDTLKDDSYIELYNISPSQLSALYDAGFIITVETDRFVVTLNHTAIVEESDLENYFDGFLRCKKIQDNLHKDSSKSECCNSTKEGEIIKFLLSDDFINRLSDHLKYDMLKVREKINA